MAGFSWPAEAMGSCWSCLYRDPIRDNHLTKFKVNNNKVTLKSTHVFRSVLYCDLFRLGITFVTAPHVLFVCRCLYAVIYKLYFTIYCNNLHVIFPLPAVGHQCGR